MIDEVIMIADFMANKFLKIWPYLLITVPLAVTVNMSGASKYIKRAFDAGPFVAILLATFVGAFSPFCSCTVIPVIASLLIGGVPLAPVMSFWIASPSMDPEIFFLSVGTIGWNLAVWRLLGSLILSLVAGFFTHYLVMKHWLPKNVLKNKKNLNIPKKTNMIHNVWDEITTKIKRLFSFKPKTMKAAAFCSDNATIVTQILPSPGHGVLPTQAESNGPALESKCCGSEDNKDFRSRLIKKSLDAILMVAKFMTLAFFLEAIIILYVPEEWISRIIGQGNSWAIITAAFLGIPVYTNNLAALPMISGLMTQGMSPGAALAFLIAGPTTTLPAMAAVWTLVQYRIFILYVAFVLFGAIMLGNLKSILG